MIKQIIGTVDGSDIVLKADPAGMWTATVPAKPNGEYIVALWAEDDAGNRTYFCTVLLTYDITQLCCHIKVLSIGAAWSAKDVAAVFGARRAKMTPHVRRVRMNTKIGAVRMRVIHCRLCGR